MAPSPQGSVAAWLGYGSSLGPGDRRDRQTDCSSSPGQCPQTQCHHRAKASAAGDTVPKSSMRRGCMVLGVDISGWAITREVSLCDPQNQAGRREKVDLRQMCSSQCQDPQHRSVAASVAPQAEPGLGGLAGACAQANTRCCEDDDGDDGDDGGDGDAQPGRRLSVQAPPIWSEPDSHLSVSSWEGVRLSTLPCQSLALPRRTGSASRACGHGDSASHCGAAGIHRNANQLQ